MVQLGYSNRPFIEKLGIKPGFLVAIIDHPKETHRLYDILPKDVTLTHALRNELDVIHFFIKDKKELEAIFPRLAHSVKRDGMVWISWPKGSSNLETDLNENIIRAFGIANGMVDVKVIAVDENWSGLKFVFRIKDR